MRIPESLISLTDEGIIERVVRPLMSGKEAQVYLVSSDGQLRVAKVYKEAQNRSFRQRAEYTEGRRVRNSRDQRAIDSRSRHGRQQDEAAWRSAEVDTLYRLEAAGVRVPKPFHFVDGVLIMELITDIDGNPAPRLGDVQLDRVQANGVFHQLLCEVVRMLCAGVVHGDLSDFNVLLGTQGPVIIDFPQSISAASNQNARKLLLRDVDNLHRFLAQYAPAQRPLPYAQEMWQLYQCGELSPDTKLLGRFRAPDRPVDTGDVLSSIGEAERDARRRHGARPGPRGGHGGHNGHSPDRNAARRPPGPIVEVRRAAHAPSAESSPARAATPPVRPREEAVSAQPAGQEPPRKKRRRRRRRGGGGSAGAAPDASGSARPPAAGAQVPSAHRGPHNRGPAPGSN